MDTNAIDSPEYQNPLQIDTSPSSNHHPISVDQTLQFKDIQQKISEEEEIGVQNVYGNACFPTTPYNVEVTESSSLNTHVLTNMTNPLCVEENGDFPMEVQQLSGIGLHLNRIVSSMHGRGTVLPSEIASPNTIATNSVCNMSNLVSETRSPATTPLKGISSNSDLSLPIDDQSNLYHNGTHKPEITRSEDLSSPLPNRRRKKVSITDVSYRRCNCRRTKCLKLYCDCFAAGQFCDKMCACQDCWNTELYEDTVFNFRQKIQSRNPLAFVPKIQQDDSTHSTPSSARHKRGCNCKKSKCLKKYCECYQANIECSDGCRCEGCENVASNVSAVSADKSEYAVKNTSILKQGTGEATDFSSDMQLEMAQQNDLSNNMSPTDFSSDMQLEMVAQQNDLPIRHNPMDFSSDMPLAQQNDLPIRQNPMDFSSDMPLAQQNDLPCHNPMDFSSDMPLEMVAQHSSDMPLEMVAQQNDLPIRHNPMGRHNPMDFSSDMPLEMVAQQNGLSIHHNMSPILPSTQFSTYAEGAANSWYSSGNCFTGAIIDTPYGTRSTFHANSHDIKNKMISMSPFDMQSDPGMDYMNQLSPIFNEPGILSAIPTNSQNWVTSTTNDQMNWVTSTTNDQIETARSVHRHTSPIDPINRFEGNRFLGTVYDIADNGMPEIPAESPIPTNTNTPPVKIASPSKKRVSTRNHETAMGRKFILQSVPSSTPYSLIQKKNDGDTNNDYPF